MNTFHFEFDEKDMQILNSALIELPFKVVAPLIDKINRQLTQAQNDDNKQFDTLHKK